MTASILFAGDAMTFGVALAGIVLATRRWDARARRGEASSPLLDNEKSRYSLDTDPSKCTTLYITASKPLRAA